MAKASKPKDPWFQEKQICNTYAQVLYRSPNEDFLEKAFGLLKDRGILEQTSIDQALEKFADDTDGLRLELSLQVYEMMAIKVFKIPPEDIALNQEDKEMQDERIRKMYSGVQQMNIATPEATEDIDKATEQDSRTERPITAASEAGPSSALEAALEVVEQDEVQLTQAGRPARSTKAADLPADDREERPYGCGQCGERFKSKGHLKRHLMVRL